MATINASRWGYARVIDQTSHQAARNASAGSAQANPSGTTTSAIRYRKRSGGRSFLFDIYRTYIYFDTSTVTGTVSNASVSIVGGGNNSTRTILVPSTAFSGDGSTNLAGSEFGNVSFNTTYNTSIASWSTSGANVYNLLGQAELDIQNNDYFICAILQHGNDYSNSEPAIALDIDLTAVFPGGRGGNLELSFTETSGGGPSNLASWGEVAKSSIDSLDAVSFSNISQINGVN